MSKICIHIGTHKTGTTYVQNLFHKNRRGLAQGGVVFPQIATDNRHHTLAGAWNAFFVENQGDAHVHWKRLSRNYSNTDKTVLISSEELSRLRPTIRSVDMAELRALVEDFDEVVMLCVFRNQASFIQSVFQQVAANPRISTWENFLKRSLSEQSCDGLSLNYSRLYSHFLTGFSRSEIRLISYDHETRNSGGIVDAILREVGADMSESDFKSLTPAESHISPAPLATYVAKKISGSQPVDPDLLTKVGSRLERLLGAKTTSTIFSREEVSKISETFEETNSALSDRIAYLQPDFAVGPMLPNKPQVYREDLTPTMMRELMKGL